MSQLSIRVRIALTAPEIPASFVGSYPFPQIKPYQSKGEDKDFFEKRNKALATRQAEWAYAYADAVIEAENIEVVDV